MSADPQPITEELAEQWHRLLAITMFLRGERTIKITQAEMDRFAAVLPGGCIVLQPQGDLLTLRLVSAAEGDRLARLPGGPPVYEG